MGETTSIQKGPDEDTQISTPESITGITGLPEKVLSITENTGIDLNEISNKIYKIENDSILGDLFYMNRKGNVFVKENSEILKGHFPGLHLVPGVVLVKLFEVITGKKLNYGDKTISFDGMIIPGHSIIVKEDGLYQKETKILSISENLQIPFETNNQEEKKDKIIGPRNSIEIDPNLFLLQSDPIRLAKSCELECHSKVTPNIGDKIKGEINPKMLDDNSNVDRHFLTEGAAQVLSSGVSYILNGGETKEQKGEKFEFLTFKTLSTKHLFDIEKWQGPFRVEAELINVEKREITGIYKIVDKSGEIIQEGTISGTTMKKSVLIKSYKRIKNNLEKDILINKIDNLVRENGLYNYLSIDKDNGTVIIKKKLSINILKTLYIELFQDINLDDLNKDYYNTIINEGDILDIKLDGLYKNGKEIIKTPKKRLEEKNKLSEIFHLNGNRIEINNELIGKYSNEEIENLLIELQNLLTQNKKINIYGDNANYVVNNRYKHDEQIYFDEIKGIYVIKENERIYFFEKFTQNHIIINKND